MRAFGAGGATVADLGEEGLLARLLERAAASPSNGLVIGPGDDAAVWCPPPRVAVVTTQDVLVEDVDFLRSWTTPYLLGRRALTVSLSDLAAMGARPAQCLVSLCLPPSTFVDDVLALQLGLLECAAAYGCQVAGGDVSEIRGPLVVDVTALGTVGGGLVLRRDAGRPGDVLLVTGVLGRAAAGLRLLRDGGVDATVADARTWRQAQLEPAARVEEGLRLAAAGVRCAGDLSDGLLVDVRRTAAASGCGAVLWLDRLPVDASLRQTFGEDWLELAVGGGEEFELLAAAPREVIDSVRAAWPATLASLTEIGCLVGDDAVRLLETEGGDALPLPPVRSRHFT